MASATDDDVVLSDVEGEDPAPLSLGDQNSELSLEKLGQILKELDGERLARKAAEAAKADLQTSFNRLKVLAHEAIKKRDEVSRQRDEALREKEEALRAKEGLVGELTEALRLREEAMKQRDELQRHKDEMNRLIEETQKTRDSFRSEIEATAQLLVSETEKIAAKVNSFKTFASGLPRSTKYTGLPAIAYGVTKRADEIVDELLRQIDNVSKSRNDVREQMEQRNYEIAIEVSQLEATISRLKENLSEKSSELESSEKSVSAKDLQIAELNKEMSEKSRLVEQEAGDLRQLVEELNAKLRGLESKIERQRLLVFDQLNYISKAHDQLYFIIKIIDTNSPDQAECPEDRFLPHEMDMDENLRTSLDGTISVFELSRTAAEKVRIDMETKNNERKDLQDKVARLVAEQQHIGTLLRSALSKKMGAESLNSDRGLEDRSSKMSSILQVAGNGVRDAGIDFKFGSVLENCGNWDASNDKEDEVFGLAGALEKIVRASQIEIIELRRSCEALRAESSLLKARLETQAKELNQRKLQIKELEETERAANENVEGLMMDIAAAEEEIARWKAAAEQEAAAGRAVEEEFLAQLGFLKKDLEEAKLGLQESENKLKFKEETAAAAMSARDAAEKSLRLADARAARLTERIEELNRQLEELENRSDLSILRRQRYICWPWQWLGLNFVGPRPDADQNTNEMELSEPLL
ncbi:hypothetical protein AMTRI_Chr06g198500 [Amborella trichopoda]|uniref:Uncharacterized protein n=1 Tax=Amborella trichopoda TaxID=13333 RepID=W1PS56_AMBTC|nr:myosin-10 [Amborella trichopoda]ERN10546.1 hypothetical protein AMTR_s00166p00076690 [Amborella trichopoda]|eukprot:XP_011625113.1 myosin-10 [Amborella trichopoda]